MKNLNVLSAGEYKINKLLVHKLMSGLKNTLGFQIEQLQIIFIASEEIHAINKEYLKHDYSTDIITFNYSEEKSKLDGEIYISVEDADQNAKKYKVNLANELIRLIIHGILHLLGYDDIDAKDKRVMKQLENKLVNDFQHFDKKSLITI